MVPLEEQQILNGPQGRFRRARSLIQHSCAGTAPPPPLSVATRLQTFDMFLPKAGETFNVNVRESKHVFV